MHMRKQWNSGLPSQALERGYGFLLHTQMLMVVNSMTEEVSPLFHVPSNSRACSVTIAVHITSHRVMHIAAWI